MKMIYTCYACGFPIACDEKDVPDACPGCGAPKSQFLKEPWCGSIEKRRIHVDPPKSDPNRDPLDISFHVAKDFVPQKGNGRVRKWVMKYKTGQKNEIQEFYKDCFGWDIVNVKDENPENPIMYCATGPGTPDWEPRVCSFGYGYIIPDIDKEPAPSFIAEVKDIDETIAKTIQYGGKVIKSRFSKENNDYAIVEDSEGNQFYLWEVKEDPDYVKHPITNIGAQ